MQQEQQQKSPEYNAYDDARRQREKTEGRCLLGLVVWSIVQQALSKRTDHVEA